MTKTSEDYDKGYKAGLSEGITRGYREGYAKRQAEINSKLGGVEPTIIAKVTRLIAECEGLPTEAIAHLIGVRYDGKYGQNARQIRQALKTLGFKQANGYHGGRNVAAWRRKPRTTTRDYFEVV